MIAKNLLSVVIATLILFVSGQAESAATIMVTNNDAAGVGFNDPTVVAAVGGNAGTTVGAQRLNAFNFAAGLWAARLTSAVTINVGGTFGPLACTALTGTLGSAGPSNGLIPGAFPPFVPAGTIVAVAEAEKLLGANQNGAAADIDAGFNGDVGKTGCLENSAWYYGFDKNPPAGAIDFVTVLLHELAHGLGFLTFIDSANGMEAGGNPDIFEVNLRDNTTAKDWTAMTDAERIASSINTNNLVWKGTNVTTGATATSGQDGSARKLMYTPPVLSSGSSVSHWTQSAAGGSACATCTDLTPIDLMRPSITVPVHTTFLTHLALMDMGWGNVAAPVALQSFSVE